MIWQRLLFGCDEATRNPDGWLGTVRSSITLGNVAVASENHGPGQQGAHELSVREPSARWADVMRASTNRRIGVTGTLIITAMSWVAVWLSDYYSLAFKVALTVCGILLIVAFGISWRRRRLLAGQSAALKERPTAKDLAERPNE